MIGNVSRNKRVEDVIHKAIASAIRQDFKDPRVGMVTVMSVTLTKDLKSARIYVSVLEEEKVTETIAILNKGVGFFRSCLASALRLRVVPRLQFVYDESVVRGSRMETLIASCVSTT